MKSESDIGLIIFGLSVMSIGSIIVALITRRLPEILAMILSSLVYFSGVFIMIWGLFGNSFEKKKRKAGVQGG